MTIDSFKRAEFIQRQILLLKRLIGEDNVYQMMGIGQTINSAEQDPAINEAVKNKIASLQQEFDKL